MGEVIGHPAAQPGKLRGPERLTSAHDLSAFDCGEPELNEWLRNRAIDNEATGASRTYVVCTGMRVVGFYCLANGGVLRDSTTGKVRRNMPDPIPVMVIGRLAVDLSCRGQKLGPGLIRDAVLRTMQAADLAGIRAILVHAKSESAKAFYEKLGFAQSPVDPITLMITVADAKRILGL